VEEFLRNLRQSNLLTPEQWKSIRDEAGGDSAESVPGETASEHAAGRERPSVSELAKRLVERGLVTSWQAEKLLQGKKAFFLGRYKLLDCIGTGGMGAVFKAVHCELGRIVAIKMLSAEVMKNRQAVARFRKEIQAVAALDHPHIVAAYDAGSDKGVHYLVMEYVDGHDLGYLLKESGPLPVDWSCECIRQAAKGLQSAHEKGMIHRDIKPTNLLVATDPDTGSPRVKILDLGLARFVTETVKGGKDGSLTLLGQFLGTPDYISPEQAHDTRSADIRSDIFSLGCTLFRLLTGELPFAGETVLEKLEARETGEALRIQSLRPDVPAELDAVVARMLARDPRSRYQTPREVAAALAPFARRAGNVVVPRPAVAGGNHQRLRQPEDDSRLDEFLKNLATAEARRAPSVSGPAARLLRMHPARWLAIGGLVLMALAAVWLWQRRGVAPSEKAVTVGRGGRIELTPELQPAAVTMRRARLDELGKRVAGAAGGEAMSPAAKAVGDDLLSFLREHPTTTEAREARDFVKQLRWPLDLLDERPTGIPDPSIQQSSPDGFVDSRLVPVRHFGDGRMTFWNAVTAVAMSQDGRFLAGASGDGTVQVFEAARGTRRQVIVPPAVPGELSFRSGSPILAVAGTSGPVTLWNAAEGTLVATLAGTTAPAVFSRDGSLIATGAARQEIALWDAGSGELRRTMQGHSAGALRGLEFSPGGKLLASWGTDGSAILWDVASGQERRIFAGSQRPLFSPDDAFLAVGSSSGDLVLWDTRTGETQRTLDDGGYPLAFLERGARLVSRRLGRAILWNLATGEEIRTLVEVPELAIVSADEQWLAGGDDAFGELRIWNLNGAAPRRDLSVAGPVTALAGGGESATIVVGTRNHVVQEFDAASGKERTPVRHHPGPADLSPDGRLLAMQQGSDITLVDVTTAEPVLTIAASAADLESLSFSPDGRLLAGFGGWGFFRTSLRLWSASDGRELFLMGDPPGTVQSLAFSADAQLLASAGDSRLVTVWDTARLELQHTLDDFPDRVTALAIHPDGRQLAVACQDQTLGIWDLKSSTRATKKSTPSIACRQLVYSGDGKLLAGSGDHRVLIWRTDHSGAPCELATGDANPLSLACDPAGRSLVAAGDDGALRFWNDPARERIRDEPDQIIRIGPPHGIVRRVIWSVDGRHIVTVNGNGTIYVLRVGAK
jgi:WD40 repeat protein/serine/threonine protein kinase